LAVEDFKLAGLALAPLGKEIVSHAEARRLLPGWSGYGMASCSGGAAPPDLPAPTGDDISF
jgi:hypothetical protein